MPMKKTKEDDGLFVSQCLFADEYNGPPLSYHISRAVPINVERIPIAAVVSPVCLSDEMSFPVIQPILSVDSLNKNFLRDNVSPTSVIGNCGSTDLDLVFESISSTVSPNSVIVFEEQTEDGGDAVDSYGIFGVLSSSSELVNHQESRILDSCDSFDQSRVSSGRSKEEEKESLDLNESCNESVLSMDYPSSRVTGDCISETNGDGKKQPAGTFLGIASDDGSQEEEEACNQKRIRVMPVRKQPQTKGKKGSCYKCFKGSRFTVYREGSVSCLRC